MSVGLAEAREILAGTPAALRALLAGRSAGWTEADEGPGTWTPREVVAHMADLEATDWMPRVKRILERGDATPFDPVEREAFRERFAGVPLGDLLATFEARRAANLEELDRLGLSPADLQRPALHPALGGVTLSQLLATWAVHDLTHLAQIVRVMAKRYDVEVGPWKAYLSVLTR